KNSKRYAQCDAHRERDEYEPQMLGRQAQEIRAEKLLPEILPRLTSVSRSARSLCKKLRSNRCEILAVELGRGVHAPHRGLSDRARELLQRAEGARQARRQVGAIKQHRVVARKVAAIVGKHRESVLVDLGVGGIDVDEVDLMLADRFVRNSMVESARRV